MQKVNTINYRISMKQLFHLPDHCLCSHNIHHHIQNHRTCGMSLAGAILRITNQVLELQIHMTLPLHYLTPHTLLQKFRNIAHTERVRRQRKHHNIETVHSDILSVNKRYLRIPSMNLNYMMCRLLHPDIAISAQEPSSQNIRHLLTRQPP